MTAREIEIINETEIFTEALVTKVAQGDLTVDQLKLQIEGGLAYVEAQGVENVAEELLVALAALNKTIQRVTSLSQADIARSEFPSGDYAGAAATDWRFQKITPQLRHVAR
jgi:hypothetical protein